MLDYWTRRDQSPGVTAIDPSPVFVVKSLLYPVAAVLTLIICLVSWRESLYGPYFLIAVLAFLGAADFLDVAQVHGSPTRSDAVRSFVDILVRWMLVITFIWALLHLSGLSGQFKGGVLLSWALLTPVVLWSGQLSARYFLLRAGVRHMAPRKAVVVGLTELGARLASKLGEDPLLRIEVIGFFEDRAATRLPADARQRVLGKTAELPDFVVRHDVSVVYIALPMARDPRVLRLLDALRDSTVSIYFIPDLFVFNLIQARFDLLSGIPLVAVRESPFYGVRGAAKRLSDIVIAVAFIAVLSPLLLAVAVGVRTTSPGPVMFRQKRYGLDGKEIIIYKFRSMSVTEDGDKTYTQVARNDARVTPFGAFIRRASLDELPQLFNVLEGSMSIVGPRPHAIAVNEQYRRLIPSYMVRHKVKPGITGWAQINGYRGGDDLASMQKRIEFDLQYLRHWSLQLDLMIMVKTATLIWLDRRAY